VNDASKNPFGARSVIGPLLSGAGLLFDFYEVFGTGKYEGILPVIVEGNPFAGFPCDVGSAQRPAKAKRPVPCAGGV